MPHAPPQHAWQRAGHGRPEDLAPPLYDYSEDGDCFPGDARGTPVYPTGRRIAVGGGNYAWRRQGPRWHGDRGSACDDALDPDGPTGQYYPEDGRKHERRRGGPRGYGGRGGRRESERSLTDGESGRHAGNHGPASYSQGSAHDAMSGNLGGPQSASVSHEGGGSGDDNASTATSHTSEHEEDEGDDDNVSDASQHLDSAGTSVTDADAAPPEVADIGPLLLARPKKLLEDALERGKHYIEMDRELMSQTVMMLEEGLKKADQIQQRRARSAHNLGGAAATGAGNGGDNGDGDVGASANNAPGSANGDDNDDVDDDDDDDEVPADLLARSNHLLARLYASTRFDRYSPARSVTRYERALEHLSTSEMDKMLWATIHIELARTLLELDHASNDVSPIHATPAEREAAIADGDVANPFAAEARNITSAIEHAKNALEVYERDASPREFGNAWVALGEAYARRVDMPRTHTTQAQVSENNNQQPTQSNLSVAVSSTADDSIEAIEHVKTNILEARKCYDTALTAVTLELDAEECARIHIWLAHLALRYRIHCTLYPSQTSTSDTGAIDTTSVGEASAGATTTTPTHDDTDATQPKELEFGAEQALHHLRRAADVFTRKAKHKHHGNIQHTMGVAYMARADDLAIAAANTPAFSQEFATRAASMSQQQLRDVYRHVYRAVKAFSRALAIKTWATDAGFDYMDTVQKRSSAQAKLRELDRLIENAHEITVSDSDNDDAGD